MIRNHHILAINPGTTSTKVAVYADDTLLQEGNLKHQDRELAASRGRPILMQLPMRIAAIDAWLRRVGFDQVWWSMVAARGGLLKPVVSGVYDVDRAMLDELRAARRGEHAANLGAFLAQDYALHSDCPAVVVDPVSVDELSDEARVSGLAGIERVALSHALNTKAVAHQHAALVGRAYEELRLIVVHMGSGISVSAHRDGRMVDVNNSREEGPFSADRSGGLPVLAAVQQALRAGWTEHDAELHFFREGGLYSYLGTRDTAEAMARANAGDCTAQRVLAAMLYQTAKEAGAMAAVLDGRVDAVLLTGGMTHAAQVTERLAAQLAWIAPVHAYPGEDELRALAAGALRVLRAEEALRSYAALA